MKMKIGMFAASERLSTLPTQTKKSITAIFRLEIALRLWVKPVPPPAALLGNNRDDMLLYGAAERRAALSVPNARRAGLPHPRLCACCAASIWMRVPSRG